MSEKIIINKAKCRLCGEVLISEHRHDWKQCRCGELSIDGGNDYIRRVVKTDLANIIELSEKETE